MDKYASLENMKNVLIRMGIGLVAYIWQKSSELGHEEHEE